MGNCLGTPIRTSKVIPIGPADEKFRQDNTDLKHIDVSQNPSQVVSANSRFHKFTRSWKNKSDRSTNSLGGSISSFNNDQDSDGEKRGLSAGSKFSGQSSDSGIGEENTHIITEHSEQHLIDEVEETFQSNGGLELEIKGVRCPTRMNARQRARHDEAEVLQILKDEGFVTKTNVESVGGLSFEIVQEKHNNNKPPARLEKLEKRRKKKKILTEEEIQAKLDRAEQRRNRREEERLTRIRMARPETPSILDVCAQRIRRIDEMQTQKMGQVIDNREQVLKEIRDKLREQERHAQDVRRRKQCNLDDMTPQPEEISDRAGLTSAFKADG